MMLLRCGRFPESAEPLQPRPGEIEEMQAESFGAIGLASDVWLKL